MKQKNKQSIEKLLLLTFAWLITTFSLTGQSTAENYIARRTYIDTLGRYTTTIRYFDGLGRPYRTVQKNAVSPGIDLVTATEYDSQGRDSLVWLPVKGRDGLPLTGEEIRLQAAALYNNDARPYTQNLYEPSALNRISKVYGPGQAWHAADRPVATSYLSNSLTDSALICRKYVVKDAYTLEKKGVYPAASLYVTETKDEDGHRVLTFKNTFGQVLLIRSFPDASSGTPLDTYYVYDGHGMLCWVLPPLAADALAENTSWRYNTSSAIMQYAYYYCYDGQQQMITKKLPGCERTEFIYDLAGRLALIEDGNLRSRRKMQYFYYDVFGNVRETGLCSLLQHQVLDYYRNYISNNRFAVQGHTASSYMEARKGLNVIENITPLHYYWYDDYGFLSKPGFAGKPEFKAPSENAKGKLTGSQTMVFGSSDTIRTVYRYDRKGRLCHTVANNLAGGYDRETLTYTFTGKVKTKEHIHTSSATAAPRTQLYTYTYDDWGKLLATDHRLDGGPTVRLSSQEYNTLGQVSKTGINNDAYTTAYSYNIRGWQTGRQSPLFTQQLHYHTGAGTPYYNGNISSMSWKSGSETILRSYRFTCDGLNRLTSSLYGEGDAFTSNINRYTENMTYDKMGNILSVKRYGPLTASASGLVDDLSLIYFGNQLQRVTDAAPAAAVPTGGMHFTGGSEAETTCRYDGNGNLITDLNRGIETITYNLLNLPQKIALSGGDSICYVYSADGNKLRVQRGLAGSSATTDYVSNMVYDNGILSKILTENGYIDLSGATPAYHYYLTDHLGNNRVVIDSQGTAKQVNQYYPFGGTMAESTGGKVQPWKFGGKELEEEGGLNRYDFGARRYDPLLAGWTTFDPLAEKNYSWSPYAYCLNNPVRYIDPKGEEVRIYYRDENDEMQSLLYSANMEYSGGNEFVSKMVNYLNAVYENGGAQGLNTLIGSEHSFNIKNSLPADGRGNTVQGMSFEESSSGGGTIYAGFMMGKQLNEYQKIESLSHELFHGIQAENGQGGPSIFNEVEANVYGAVIAGNWAQSSDYFDAMSSNGLGNNSQYGSRYEDSFKSLVRNGFDNKTFIEAVRSFKRGSAANASGGYNKYPHRPNQKRYLLKTYYPKVK